MYPRSSDEERHAGTLLVRAVLPGAYAVLASEPAVVGGEEDVGVLQLPGRLELLDQSPYHLIHRQHRLQALAVVIVDLGDLFVGEPFGLLSPGGLVGDVLLVEGGRPGSLLLSEGSLVALCRSRGAVGGGGGHVGEEGLLHRRRPPHEVARFFGEDVGEEVLGLAAVGDYLAVLVEPVVVELLSVQLAVPLVPTRREVAWTLVARITVEVLAEEGGLVAAILQSDGDGVLLVSLGEELFEAPIGGRVSPHVVVVIVEAGE